MMRNVLCLVLVGAVVYALAASADRDAGAAASPISSSSTRVRAIDRALTLYPGRARSLYALRGYYYGRVGRFVVSCTRTGFARTAYQLGEAGPDATVAVDGRGDSRAAKLVPPSGTLPGGSRRSGIEQWIVLTGGKPESIRLDTSLLVVSAKAVGGCAFSLRGTVAIRLH
jgi:hypothetical protein